MRTRFPSSLRGGLAVVALAVLFAATATETQAAKLTASDVEAGAQVKGRAETGPFPNLSAGGYTTCPTGTRVFGGGAAFDDDEVGWVTSSSPTFSGDGWYAHGFRIGEDATVIKTRMSCLPAAKLAGSKLATDTGKPDAGGFTKARAECPGNTRVYTGGAFISRQGNPNGPDLSVVSDAAPSVSAALRDGSGWTAAASSDSDSVQLTAVAHCLAPKRLGDLERVEATYRTTRRDTVKSPYLDCGPGGQVIAAPGASWQQAGDAPNRASTSKTFLAGLVNFVDSFRLSSIVHDNEGRPPLELTVSAFCLS